MRSTRDIYDEYRIPPWLQLHQLRVAAVGKMVCEGLGGAADADLIVRTCLVHDIGAIVKFDLTPEGRSHLENLCPTEDLPYWAGVQKEFRERYGYKESPATDAILRELGLEGPRSLFSRMGMANMQRMFEEDDLQAQAAQYGDTRVGPYGIVPFRDRLADVSVRYAEAFAGEGRQDEVSSYIPTLAKIEERLFSGSSIRPGDIHDAAAAPLIEELWDYPLA